MERWVILSAMNGARFTVRLLVGCITTVSNGVVDLLAILDSFKKCSCLGSRYGIGLDVVPHLSIRETENLVDIERRITGRIVRGRRDSSWPNRMTGRRPWQKGRYVASHIDR